MSLINDALKKAQRQRADTPFDVGPPMPGGGGRIAKRGAPMSAQTIVLIVAGCIVLVVLSMVGTVFLFRDNSPAEKSDIVRSLPTPKLESTPGATEPKTDLSVPLIVVNVEEKNLRPPPQPSPAPITEPKAEPKPVAVVPTASDSPPVAAPVAPPVRPAAPSLPPGQQDERVHAFLDTLRVNGILPSGSAGSRVLMNQRVYRVNDVVDRALNLKITEVRTDSIIFTDANGATYSKNF